MSHRAHFILLAIGSRGDVDPLKWIGLELARRGHEILFLTLPAFSNEAERLGLRTVATPPDLDFKLGPKEKNRPLRRLSRSLDDWVRGRRIFQRRAHWILKQIQKRHIGGKTVVVGRTGLVAGRMARELFDVRLATVHHSPASMRSRVESYRFFDGSAYSLPRRLALRMIWWGMDAYVGILLLPSLNRLRATHGLPRISRMFDGWAPSPDLNLGLFPSWYAEPQPDWPANSRLSGFPIQKAPDELPQAVRQFLSSGEMPLLVTIGAHEDPGGKLEQTVRALASQGAFRCIFLGRQTSTSAGSGLMHCEFVPLNQLLPHCRAILHHGGIGTMFAAFVAGTPQLVLPIVGDQWDQARRAAKLGCAKILHLRTLERSLPRALGQIETDPQIRAACRAIREKAVLENGVQIGADLLEDLANRADTRLEPEAVSISNHGPVSHSGVPG